MGSDVLASCLDVHGAAHVLSAAAKILFQDRAGVAYKTATHAGSFRSSQLFLVSIGDVTNGQLNVFI